MLKLYTDGGCLGNPGVGGWAAVLEGTGYRDRIILSGREPATTNNRMELTAVIQGLQYICRNTDNASGRTAPPQAEVFTDSQYVQKGITEWVSRWEKNGWKTAAKKPVKNADLWRHLRELDQALDLRWEWVRGHAGHEQNELCDTLVGQEMERF